MEWRVTALLLLVLRADVVSPAPNVRHQGDHPEEKPPRHHSQALATLARRLLNPPPPPSAPAPSALQTSYNSVCPDMQAVLQQHNGYRARHGVPMLQHNDSLSYAAAGWAQTLAEAGCILEHSDLNTRPGQGENLYAFWAPGTGSMDCAFAVQPWYNELAMYNFAKPSDALINLPSVGHFTQLVWRSSAQVGCGVGSGYTPTGQWCKVVACRYSPPGNILAASEFAANIPPPLDEGSCPDQQPTLDAVNALRANHDAPSIEWSTSLAAGATAVARSIAFDSRCSGGGVKTSTPQGVQQSVLVSQGLGVTDNTCDAAVPIWYKQYNFTANTAQTSSRDFALLVWRDALSMGCGTAVANVTQGPTCEVVVCWYDVPSYAVSTQAYSTHVSPPAGPAGSCSDAATVLAMHNAARAARQAAPLVWDASLASGAGLWSSQLAGGKCTADSSVGDAAHVAGYGESVYAVSGGKWGNSTCNEAVTAWVGEGAAYDDGTGGAPSQLSPAAVGHFTQAVWRATSRVGCGVATGTAAGGLPCKVVTCRYAVPGNEWSDEALLKQVGQPGGAVALSPRGAVPR